MVIYKWTNTVNGKIYIGQTTKNINYRTRMHVNSTNSGTNFPLHNAIRKYGKEAFTVEIIHTCASVDELNKKEIEAIAEYNCKVPYGYNLKDGGNNQQWHPDMKKNASLSAKARMERDGGVQVKTALAKGREVLKGKAPWNKGLKATEEARANQSAAHKGRPAWNKGHKTSEKTKEKQKFAAQKRAKPVRCIETQIVWPSIEECARTVCLSPTHIRRLILFNKKSSNGYSFEYLKRAL